jgi:hypothetical protein
MYKPWSKRATLPERGHHARKFKITTSTPKNREKAIAGEVSRQAQLFEDTRAVG